MRHGHDDACRIGLNGSRRIRPITPSSSHPPSSPHTTTIVTMVRVSCRSDGSGAGIGIGSRCPDISRRCVLTPYGVHVISVTRSSPGTILSCDVSSGLMTVMRSTS